MTVVGACSDLFTSPLLAARADRAGYLLMVGESFPLDAHLVDGVAHTWAALDPEIATIDELGIVTGHAFGVATFRATARHRTDADVRVWVSTPTTAFAAASSGCPTPAETAFVAAAFPIRSLMGDTTTALCHGTTSTVSMPVTQAALYRAVTALAGVRNSDLHLPSLPWQAGSFGISVFEWLAFESGMHGWRVLPLGPNIAGSCCDIGGVIRLDPSSALSASARRLSFIAHEARHILYGPHTCQTVRLDQTVQLDTQMSEQGPYAVEVEVLEAFATAAALEPVERSAVLNTATTIRQNLFCVPQ